MKITRWNAEMASSFDIIENLFSLEGLDSKHFTISSGSKLINQKTLLTEVIQLINGELIFNLSGNQFALRPGDRLEIPANTTYSVSNLRENDSSFFSAYKV